jgi:hypothetical protein
MFGELLVTVEAFEISARSTVRLRLQLVEPKSGRSLVDFGVKTMGVNDTVTLTGATTTVGVTGAAR